MSVLSVCTAFGVPSPGASMKLRKWYADCVSTDGNVFIGYSARISLGPFSLPYQSSMTGRMGEALSQSNAISREGTPEPEASGATLSCAKLDVAGSWSRAFPAFQSVLLDTPDVTIDWRCHVPGAAAEVRVGDLAFRGWGYLEELRIDGDPRAIPIRELRWGRWLGEQDSVVWIDWRGDHPLTLVLHNGLETESSAVSDDAISFDGFRLGLGRKRRWTLRDEFAEESVFPQRTWLRPLLPRALARIREVKWAASECLERPDGTTSRGWTLYKRVDWP